MYKPSDVDDYIAYHENWSKELEKLRSVLLQSELDETIKWFIPTYTFKNKNVIGLGAFKEWVAIWFFQGSFLLDPYQILVNAQDGKTKGLRQWRFRKEEEIDVKKVLEYIIEAVENQKQGLEIKIDKPPRTAIEIPDKLKLALANSKEARYEWESFSIAKRNEYCRYILEAKQESTKERRVVKIIPIIEAGKGLNDRYK